jgi:hypothetical protein
MRQKDNSALAAGGGLTVNPVANATIFTMDDAFELTRKIGEDLQKAMFPTGLETIGLDLVRDLPYLSNPPIDRASEIIRSIKSAPQSQAENVQEAIRSHIDRLQQNLAQDEELQVYCTEGSEKIRVQQIGYPNWHVVILIGTDTEGNTASIITNINSVKLVCKVAKVKPPQKPWHVGFVQPDSQ